MNGITIQPQSKFETSNIAQFVVVCSAFSVRLVLLFFILILFYIQSSCSSKGWPASMRGAKPAPMPMPMPSIEFGDYPENAQKRLEKNLFL